MTPTRPIFEYANNRYCFYQEYHILFRAMHHTWSRGRDFIDLLLFDIICTLPRSPSRTKARVRISPRVDSCVQLKMRIAQLRFRHRNRVYCKVQDCLYYFPSCPPALEHFHFSRLPAFLSRQLATRLATEMQASAMKTGTTRTWNR